MRYGYARVSSTGQARDGNSLEAQEKALRDAGAEVVYKEAFTGMKLDRPRLNELLQVLRPGDTLIVTKLDRMARSAAQGSELIEGLIDKGVIVHILNMGIMDNTSTGKLIRMLMFAFAEFERNMIVERTQEGRAMAKRNDPNYHEGRKRKYTRVQIDHALDLLQDHSYRTVEQMTGISRSTLVRAKREKSISG